MYIRFSVCSVMNNLNIQILWNQCYSASDFNILYFFCMKHCNISMGRGKMIVEFFSAAMELRLCRYRSWRADGDSAMTREASFRALEAFISPSAAMIWNRHTIRGSLLFPQEDSWFLCWMVFTFALASRLASASAAIARCICWGNFTSLISTRSTLMPHESVATSKASCKSSKSLQSEELKMQSNL